MTTRQWIHICIAVGGVLFVLGFLAGALVAKHQLGAG